MKKLIVDFDNTINVKGCDIDDAFALFYLLSEVDKCEILLVTTTFGNSNEDDTYNSTVKMFEELSINIELVKGGSKIESAAQRIKEVVDENPGIEILMLGSTNNISKAINMGMNIENVAALTAMGGITSDLEFRGKIMDELNFSIDYKSSQNVFNKLSLAGKKINIISGNNCIKHKYLIDKRNNFKSKYLAYIEEHMNRWAEEFEAAYKEKEIVLWDAIAALYITNPEFFIDEEMGVELGDCLKEGRLIEGKDANLNLPKVKSGINPIAYIIQTMES